jgi:hypothetical protein
MTAAMGPVNRKSSTSFEWRLQETVQEQGSKRVRQHLGPKPIEKKHGAKWASMSQISRNIESNPSKPRNHTKAAGPELKLRKLLK